jgi:diguanylate cyclase (GGDEF)-like protein/PAS domain S-box-containing protein
MVQNDKSNLDVRPARVLVVEDEKIVARDLMLALEDLGYVVPAIASTGELAIQKATELRPDLVLMDIRLAGELDGIEAAQIITKQLALPIVYLTAHADEATLARAKVTHPLGYLLKPFEERELRAVIEIALYKHEMELRLTENAQWLSVVLHSIGDGLLTTDTEGRITLLNPVAEQLTGWSCQEALGRPSTEVFKLIQENSRKPIDDLIQKVLATGESLMLPEFTLLVRKDGIELPIEDSIAPIVCQKGVAPIQDRQGHITGAVVIFRDVTQQRLSAEKLHRHAFYDDLTNLSNRTWFRERLTDATARLKRQPTYLFAVLFLDLDRFKVINDSMGHLVGDQLLVAVADRLTKACRTVDTVSRLGGDEFAILLEGLKTQEEALQVAQRIQKSLSIPVYINGQEVFTNASIGIVFGATEHQQIEDLIQDADIAMYRAKAQGKGRYQVFDTTMRDQIVATSQLERDLRRAIEREQFTVYYQPIIALSTLKPIGFEALVRWQHPQRGLVFPGEFIPLAEEAGLSVMIDWWVTKAACHQLKQWQVQRSFTGSISVNLSGTHLAQPVLVDRIQEILVETGLAAEYLTLEITETTLIENTEPAAATFAKLKALGMNLSLDDFGTGYSSLSYLQQFPVQNLKIDRSFISKIDTDPESLEITRAMILLGHILGMSIVAEGIETPSQLELLQTLRCDYGQGYYFAKPLPVTTAQDWLISAPKPG